MIEMQPLNEASLAREVLKRISDPKHIITRAVQVLELVAHSGTGLGEVLQDYAAQSCGELKETIAAAGLASQGEPADPDVLRNIHSTLKSAVSILERVPAGMLRNKAESLGEKEKLSRADIADIAHALLSSADVARLLADEHYGHTLAGLVAGAEETLMKPAQDRSRAAAAH